jgi:hypothetical protein
MPVLKYCVVVDDKVYCYDMTRDRYVEATLTPKEDARIPEIAERLIVMKRFNLKE